MTRYAAIIIVALGLSLHTQWLILTDYRDTIFERPWAYAYPGTPLNELGVADHLLSTGEYTSLLTKPFEIVAIEWNLCARCRKISSVLRVAKCETREWWIDMRFVAFGARGDYYGTLYSNARCNYVILVH